MRRASGNLRPGVGGNDSGQFDLEGGRLGENLVEVGDVGDDVEAVVGSGGWPAGARGVESGVSEATVN